MYKKNDLQLQYPKMAISWLGNPVYDVEDVDAEAIKNLRDHEKCSHQGHCNKHKFERLLAPPTPASESKRVKWKTNLSPLRSNQEAAFNRELCIFCQKHTNEHVCRIQTLPTNNAILKMSTLDTVLNRRLSGAGDDLIALGPSASQGSKEQGGLGYHKGCYTRARDNYNRAVKNLEDIECTADMDATELKTNRCFEIVFQSAKARLEGNQHLAGTDLVNEFVQLWGGSSALVPSEEDLEDATMLSDAGFADEATEPTACPDRRSILKRLKQMVVIDGQLATDATLPGLETYFLPRKDLATYFKELLGNRQADSTVAEKCSSCASRVQ